MRTRWLAVVLLSASPVAADDRPVTLPPLLTPSTPTPAAPAPKGPVGEYDHGYLYLPETAPPKPTPPPPPPPELARPLGTWWLNASFDMGWAAKDAPLPTLRLRVPGIRNGPILPLEAVSPDSFRLGFDANGGVWFDDRNLHGVQAGVYLLSSGSRATGYAPGTLVIFPNGTSQSPPQLIAFPEPLANAFYGTFPVTYSTWLTTADVNYRGNLIHRAHVRLDALVGYRFASVSDEVMVGERSSTSDQDGNSTDSSNMPRFAVTNYFHGGQVGFDGEFRVGRWSLGGIAKVAFGGVTSQLDETGVFAAPEVFTGSAFVLRPVAPRSSRFAVMPTVTTTLGWNFANDCRLFVGYSYTYLNRVARLGDLLAQTGDEPRFTDFWAQSVKLGLEIRY